MASGSGIGFRQVLGKRSAGAVPARVQAALLDSLLSAETMATATWFLSNTTDVSLLSADAFTRACQHRQTRVTAALMAGLTEEHVRELIGSDRNDPNPEMWAVLFARRDVADVAARYAAENVGGVVPVGTFWETVFPAATDVQTDSSVVSNEVLLELFELVETGPMPEPVMSRFEAGLFGEDPWTWVLCERFAARRVPNPQIPGFSECEQLAVLNRADRPEELSGWLDRLRYRPVTLPVLEQVTKRFPADGADAHFLVGTVLPGLRALLAADTESDVIQLMSDQISAVQQADAVSAFAGEIAANAVATTAFSHRVAGREVGRVLMWRSEHGRPISEETVQPPQSGMSSRPRQEQTHMSRSVLGGLILFNYGSPGAVVGALTQTPATVFEHTGLVFAAQDRDWAPFAEVEAAALISKQDLLSRAVGTAHMSPLVVSRRYAAELLRKLPIHVMFSCCWSGKMMSGRGVAAGLADVMFEVLTDSLGDDPEGWLTFMALSATRDCSMTDLIDASQAVIA